MLWLLNPLANGSRACDRVVRDIHLAHEGDARVRLCILDEILQHSHAGGPACRWRRKRVPVWRSRRSQRWGYALTAGKRRNRAEATVFFSQVGLSSLLARGVR